MLGFQKTPPLANSPLIQSQTKKVMDRSRPVMREAQGAKSPLGKSP